MSIHVIDRPSLHRLARGTYVIGKPLTGDLAGALTSAFQWCSTNEGDDFWVLYSDEENPVGPDFIESLTRVLTILKIKPRFTVDKTKPLGPSITLEIT